MTKTLIKDEFICLRQLLTRRTPVASIGLPPKSNGKKLILLLSVYLVLDLTITIIIGWPIHVIFPEIDEAYGAMEGFTALEFMLMAVFLAPPIEEFLFRLPLRYSKRNLRIWLVLSALFVLVFQYIVSLVLFSLWLYWLTRGKDRQFDVKVMRFYKRFGVAIFWFFALFFAAIHLSNFTANSLPIHLYLPAIVPQIIAGISLGVTRLRLGFWWAMLLHALFNLIVSLPSL
ncbi:MAG: CPBP family intramembrane metalloprotease [Roseivirga sp.]|nr:CPBP family intramembrane metalloprotease [Roseivirga sp.]